VPGEKKKSWKKKTIHQRGGKKGEQLGIFWDETYLKVGRGAGACEKKKREDKKGFVEKAGPNRHREKFRKMGALSEADSHLLRKKEANLLQRGEGNKG